MELHDRRTYYRAFQSHDARFDGRVFVGVTSTGIYCRPICPARCPRFENCRFFASAAAAGSTGRRFVARLWDPALDPDEAAMGAGAPVAWEGYGVGAARPDSG